VGTLRPAELIGAVADAFEVVAWAEAETWMHRGDRRSGAEDARRMPRCEGARRTFGAIPQATVTRHPQRRSIVMGAVSDRRAASGVSW
jgi:hypothetical protein